jgi:hypothetical protein
MLCISMAHEFDTIHTLEARSNFQLEWLKSHFELSGEKMHHIIRGSFLALRAGLDHEEDRNGFLLRLDPVQYRRLGTRGDGPAAPPA